MRALVAGSFLCGMLLAVPAVAGEARVSMELATQPGFPVAGSQKWYKLLVDLGVDNLRIRSARPGDEPSITDRGTKSNPSYDLVGILTAGDELILKNGRYSSRDAARLRQFLADLRSEGIAGSTEPKAAFGVTNRQLVEAVEDLTPPIAFSTAGLPLAKVVEQAQDALKLEMLLTPAAQQRVAEAGPCREELQGVSWGTGLAVLLGAEGLILQPRKIRGGEVEHLITLPDAQAEAWPMGWPPQANDRELVPMLFEFLNVEISGIPLPQALAAIEERLKIPFLLDHHALAKHGVAPDEIKPSLPATRTYYKKVLDRLLFAAKLKGELRVDEAGAPFYWITTIKP